jgi:hypothetical protein
MRIVFRRLGILVIAGSICGLWSTANAQEPERPGVTFAGEMEPPSSERGIYQRLILDLAAVWVGCDPDLMRRTLSADVDFSYPTNRVIGIDAVLAHLNVFCGIATERSIYFPKDAFYIDPANHRVAAELQFRVTQNGHRQVVNDVWIATIRDGRIAVIKEYLDGRVKTLQAEGTLTYGEDAPFLTPWPPRTSTLPSPPPETAAAGAPALPKRQ